MDWKLDVAKKCGADIVLNPSKCNLIEEIMKLTDDLGCDVYIEASGAGPSVRYNACRVLIRSERYIKSGGEEVQDKRKKIFSLYSLTRQGLNVISRMGRFVEYSVFGREVTCDWSIISKYSFILCKEHYRRLEKFYFFRWYQGAYNQGWTSWTLHVAKSYFNDC